MDNCYMGEIKIFAGNFAPRGWALCEGQLLPIAMNQNLFSLLGTTYGGDGWTTFALPDLRGRSPMHRGIHSQMGETRAIGLTDSVLSRSRSTDDPKTSIALGSLAMNFIIALGLGVFPSTSGEDGVETFPGDGRLFAFDFAPVGWAPCDGQLLPLNENKALFSLLGTTYGGDGRMNFALPDLRGSIPMHTGRHELGDQVEVEESAEPSDEISIDFLVLNYCIALRQVDRTVSTGTCPECDADVSLSSDTDKGEVISCEECGTDLEIVGLDPVELDIVEQDYDDDDDEDEY